MVYGAPKDEMTAFDWRVLGYEEPCPRKRIDVPLPYRTGGIFELEQVFTGFALKLGEIAKLPIDISTKNHMLKALYEATQFACREKQLAWREELREPTERLKVVR